LNKYFVAISINKKNMLTTVLTQIIIIIYAQNN